MLRTGALTAVLLTAMVTACGERGTSPFEPETPEVAVTTALEPGTPAAAVSEHFLSCPVTTTRSTSRTIGLLGGTLALDGHQIRIPPLAVLGATTFTLTVPASEHVEVEIHAEGRDSFIFLLPASVTLSYERCEEAPVDPANLSVWYIGGLTELLLEHMGGTANADRRRITFTTGHLSGFIIAN